ncbi:MAG: prepilin-type N-terminal cleavage/methylation domain-containing protein [Planctomycetes bacterium]|nr:prepilin-type N-terminal cleavage/methylation domain-containing protein [Planctomycetota bacterium]
MLRLTHNPDARPCCELDAQAVRQVPPPAADRRSPRGGFTLVELLVVISLMLVLAGILVMFWPGVSDSQRAAEGGSLLEGWLRIAKQRALRDQAPRGLRLYIESGKVFQAQYIEQPADYNTGTVSQPNAADLSTVQVSSLNLTGGTTDIVEPGDYLELEGSNRVHRIASVGPPKNLGLSPPLLAAIAPTTKFRIMRAPRAADGDRLEMPKDIGVDLAFSQYSGAGSAFDILFAPSGSVIGSQAHLDFLVLWVRNLTYTSGANPEFEGEPSLISVHVRSGLVAAYPPNHDPSDRYKFVREGGTTGP